MAIEQLKNLGFIFKNLNSLVTDARTLEEGEKEKEREKREREREREREKEREEREERQWRWQLERKRWWRTVFTAPLEGKEGKERMIRTATTEALSCFSRGHNNKKKKDKLMRI